MTDNPRPLTALDRAEAHIRSAREIWMDNLGHHEGTHYLDAALKEIAAARVEMRAEADAALEMAVDVAREHLMWACDPGRMTPDELRLIAGACNVIGAGISALRTRTVTPVEIVDREELRRRYPEPEEKP